MVLTVISSVWPTRDISKGNINNHANSVIAIKETHLTCLETTVKWQSQRKPMLDH